MIEKPPFHSPDSNWLAARPTVVRLSPAGMRAVIVPLSEDGIAHALKEGCVRIREIALRYFSPGDHADAAPIWRYTSGIPQVVREVSAMAELDRLLGRTDSRQPLVIRARHCADSFEQVLYVPADLAWFEGHFPGEPILAAVVQLKWAIEGARLMNPHAVQPSAIHQLKFKLPISPDCLVELAVARVDRDGAIAFTYRSAAGEHSSGRLLYGAG